jgi:hypothetical protein
VEQAECREADIKLEGLRSSTAWVRDLVLGGPIGSSSLAGWLSSGMKLIKDCVDVMATIGVCFRTWSV